MTKTQAVVETGLMPPIFRDVCEKLEIDPDADYFFGLDIKRIQEYVKNSSKIKDVSVNSTKDGYSVGEAADLLGVSTQSFNANYSHKAERIRRGVYTRESIDNLVQKKFKKSPTVEEPVFEDTTNFKKRIQRVSVHSDCEGGVMLSIHLEGFTEKELIHKLFEVFN
jgi:hypothetical protein